jgi:hypothetical protein
MRYRGVACGQLRFLLRPQGADRALPGEGPVTGAARQRNPQHFRMCAQARHRFTQVIHMVMHSKACNTFSCQAGRQRVSVPGIAGGGRHPGRGSGLRLDDIAPDGGHRILAAHPAGQAARRPQPPACCHPHVIPPTAPPRYAQAARAQSPPALALRLRHHGHEPEREAPVPNRRPGSVADHRPATAAAGALAPPEASLLATARHPVLRARTLAVLHGSVADAAALAITASGPARWPGDARPARPDPRSSRPAFRSCRRCRTRQHVPAGRIRHGPSMYEMEGPSPASPRRLASCLVFAARRPPGPGTRARGRFPGSSRVPGVAPG